MGDQRAAAFSRNGRDVAAVVAAPDAGESLWIGPNGGQAVRATDGRTLTRPSWGPPGGPESCVDVLVVVPLSRLALLGIDCRMHAYVRNALLELVDDELLKAA
jgi:hypothetical protein